MYRKTIMEINSAPNFEVKKNKWFKGFRHNKQKQIKPGEMYDFNFKTKNIRDQKLEIKKKKNYSRYKNVQKKKCCQKKHCNSANNLFKNKNKTFKTHIHLYNQNFVSF